MKVPQCSNVDLLRVRLDKSEEGAMKTLPRHFELTKEKLKNDFKTNLANKLEVLMFRLHFN